MESLSGVQASPSLWEGLAAKFRSWRNQVKQYQARAELESWRLQKRYRPKAEALAQTAIGATSQGFTQVRAGATTVRKHTLNRRNMLATVQLIVLGALIGGGVLVALGAQTLNTYASSMANPSLIINNKNTGTTILDRNGQVLYQTYGAPNRQTLTTAQTPQVLKNATLAAEDPDFYNHPAISWRGSARAIYQDILTHGKAQGGSTITQQLVKSSLLTPQKSYVRKYKEIVLATALEHKYSKDQVLEMYLNQIYYGQGANGAAAAAEVYFHEPVSQLTIAQAAMIAGLPLGPSRFDPTFDHAAALERRDFVIGQMEAHGFITPAQADAAKAEPLVAYQQNAQINAPHFVFYVLDQLRQQYGDDLVEHGGITVTTTLDLNKQHIAEDVASAQIARLGHNHVTNAGLVSLNPKNGEILTMLGSVDYNQPDWGQVNVTESQLQPGSSFKPIAYVTAFQKGWSGATMIDDKPICFPSGSGAPYCPVNYDGKFRGPVTLRRALQNSLNVPAVQVLQFAGIDNTINMAHNLGITSLNETNRYGLSLVLGGGEVSPLDMATAYATFANSGVKHEPRSILKVLDRTGKDITKPDSLSSGEAVLDPRLAYMVTNILSDNPARAEEFGPNSPLKLSRPAAAKTGTTNDFRDNWTIGYTPSLVTAVWVGNNDHSPMNGVNGITGAAPIWHDYMEQALTGTAIEQFIQPTGLITAKVCAKDGGLANPWDTGYTEVFLAEHPQTKKCASTPPPPAPTPDQTQPTAPTPTDQGQGNGYGTGGGTITPPNQGNGKPPKFQPVTQ